MSIFYKEQSSRLSLGACAISIVIILRDLVGVPVPDAALLAIASGIMLVLPYTELVPFLFFLFPFTCGIPGYVMLAAYIILLLKHKHLSAGQIFPVIIVGILEFFDELIGADFATVSGVLSFMSFTALFFFFLNDAKKTKYDIKLAILYFCLGTIVTFGVIFINMLREYGINILLAGMARAGALGIEGNDTSIMQGHLAMNSNTVAYYAICSISCLAVLFNSYRRIPILCLITAITLCGFFSISRTYILCLALIIVFYLLTASNKMRIGFLVTLMLLFVTLSFFAGEYIELFEETLIGRTEESTFDSAGGRTILFEYYNDEWLKSIWYVFFGCGVVNYFPLLGVHNAMHSGLQQIWVCLGITGFILFAQQTIAFIAKYSKSNKLIFLTPFFVTFAFDQSIQFLNPYPLMLPIVVSLLVWKVSALTKAES